MLEMRMDGSRQTVQRLLTTRTLESPIDIRSVCVTRTETCEVVHTPFRHESLELFGFCATT